MLMSKGRLEAFSDGVLAIIITIRVLQLPAPHGSDPSSLHPLVPVFLSYLVSYVYIGIDWNNHHLLQATQYVAGGILWANLNLLFWLSLIPLTTAWVGSSPLAPLAARALLRRYAIRRHRVLHSVERSHCAPWKKFAARAFHRKRPQRRDVPGALYSGCCSLVCATMGGSGLFGDRTHDVVPR